MAQIKLNATYGMTGTLPAVSGANLTTLNGTQVTSGTLPMARLSGTLPALNASALTNLDATDLSGTLPALNGSNLTNLPAGGKLLQVINATTNPAKTTLASATFAEVSSTVRATITPTASDSILFLYLQILYGGASSTNISTMKFYDITNSADVNASSDGNRTPGHAASRQVDTDTHDVDSMVLSATVSAASTSARTYGMYSTNEIAGGNTDTKYFFAGNSSISQIPTAKATFIIQEWSV